MQDLLGGDEALLILGSLFWNTFSLEDNRYHDRSEIHPVQLVIGDRIVHVPFFDSWGDLGVSSVACLPDGKLWVTTGSDLVEVDPGSSDSVRPISVPGLRDVHEITLIGDALWMANTGRDEVVAVGVPRGEVTRRIGLDPFRLRRVPRAGRDRFHCNQVFRGLDGRLYGLVHQVTGRMIGRRFARTLLRKPGDGGVLDLETGERRHLWLAAPHTVTVIGEEYWVFDSGMRRINVYDAAWDLVDRIPVPSFGRGGAVSRRSGLFFAGLSQWRLERGSREQAAAAGELDAANRIQAFDPLTRRLAGEIRVPDGLEQINNVYVVPLPLAEKLAGLS